jgi:4-hydroxybenzoate polyprenyltransferase
VVVFAVFVNQASVGISNDARDYLRDKAAGRLDKPIVSGDLPLSVAWSVAGAAATASLVLSFLVHPMVGVWQAVFLLAGWAYNLGLKSTVWSGACYAIGFGALPILVSYATPEPQFPAWWVVFVAASLGVSAHFANVLPDLQTDRHQGVNGLPQMLGPRAVPGALVVLTLASGVALVFGAGVDSIGLSAPAALLSLGLASWAAVLSTKPQPGKLPFQLSMAAALVMAIGLTAALTTSA